ncbi:hypothetical protein [Brachybacterium timonense]|uniref:hypothetical protein n=1 Tax=Brachybacterium timonense TaxID=2050896 RepID=UPI000D0ADF73|nr:hypothetical protein [Brachybacterium timonense]
MFPHDLIDHLFSVIGDRPIVLFVLVMFVWSMIRFVRSQVTRVRRTLHGPEESRPSPRATDSHERSAADLPTWPAESIPPSAPGEHSTTAWTSDFSSSSTPVTGPTWSSERETVDEPGASADETSSPGRRRRPRALFGEEDPLAPRGGPFG